MSDIPAVPNAAAPTPTAGISTDTSRLKSGANLKAAGEKFEAVFTGMMLKSMRQAKLADPLFDSKAIDTFSEMQDAQIAKTMAQHAPMGIGKAMTEFLSKSQKLAEADASKPNLNQPGTSPPK
ncbi:flagellar protein FlgJ [Sphingomonas gellani]|uniref:Flagellar protein FlgJ n=1 Tax=Sphingomonas gellani TaxID=1166340 RepID=A0A1H8CKU7_9SPHN|nr:rod-binding protein [Sphingomonas gellani]SEM95733.1 flagellar protein FlgJ [Sphingomonas gellani]